MMTVPVHSIGLHVQHVVVGCIELYRALEEIVLHNVGGIRTLPLRRVRRSGRLRRVLVSGCTASESLSPLFVAAVPARHASSFTVIIQIK